VEDARATGSWQQKEKIANILFFIVVSDKVEGIEGICRIFCSRNNGFRTKTVGIALITLCSNIKKYLSNYVIY